MWCLAQVRSTVCSEAWSEVRGLHVELSIAKAWQQCSGSHQQQVQEYLVLCAAAHACACMLHSK